jgi:transposase
MLPLNKKNIKLDLKLTKEQYEQIKIYLPVARGNVKIDNRVLINAILYMTEKGCRWRGLPKKYGKGDSVYRRVNRWAKWEY